MLLVNKDNSIEIYQGDAFSLLCQIDFEINNPEDLTFILTDENNVKIIEKNAVKNEGHLYLIFDTKETNLTPGLYNYYIKWYYDDKNSTTITNNILKVRRSA